MRARRMYISGLVVGLLWGSTASAAAENLLVLSCHGLQQARALCEAVRGALPVVTDLGEPRLTKAGGVRVGGQATRAGGMNIARALQGRVGGARVAPELLGDYGFAQLVAGQVGDGMQALLRAAQQDSAPAYRDGAFLGLALLWPELSGEQRADWAKDLAGRFVALLMDGRKVRAEARPIDLLRLVALYRVADDATAADHFRQLGHERFPDEPAFSAPTPRPTSIRPIRTPRAPRYVPDR